ncbi:hypothetical protein Dimus_037639 [Dionaea muscipula]
MSGRKKKYRRSLESTFSSSRKKKPLSSYPYVTGGKIESLNSDPGYPDREKVLTLGRLPKRELALERLLLKITDDYHDIVFTSFFDLRQDIKSYSVGHIDAVVVNDNGSVNWRFTGFSLIVQFTPRGFET